MSLMKVRVTSPLVLECDLLRLGTQVDVCRLHLILSQFGRHMGHEERNITFLRGREGRQRGRKEGQDSESEAKGPAGRESHESRVKPLAMS